MIKALITTAVMAATLTTSTAEAKVNIGKNDITLNSDLMTPEALWAMGRIGSVAASPDGRLVAYTVSYYSVKENASHTVIYMMNADGTDNRQKMRASRHGLQRLSARERRQQPRTASLSSRVDSCGQCFLTAATGRK